MLKDLKVYKCVCFNLLTPFCEEDLFGKCTGFLLLQTKDWGLFL